MTLIGGLNNFDIVYYINLEHRIDRNSHIINELKKTNITPNKINRINAVYNKELGILGCAKSHCIVLNAFIQSGKNTCIIFEDDFHFTRDMKTINMLIDRVFNEIVDFDVLMLSSNTIKELPTTFEFVTKIIDAQTASGYGVSKSFAPILLSNYRESIKLLEHIGKRHDYCFDIYMKRLQPISKWYCLYPKIGKQIESYSDIENTVVDYEC